MREFLTRLDSGGTTVGGLFAPLEITDLLGPDGSFHAPHLRISGTAVFGSDVNFEAGANAPSFTIANEFGAGYFGANGPDGLAGIMADGTEGAASVEFVVADQALIRGTFDGTTHAVAFVRPVGLANCADADAPNGTLYFSTTLNKLAYKNPAGTVHEL